VREIHVGTKEKDELGILIEGFFADYVDVEQFLKLVIEF